MYLTKLIVKNFRSLRDVTWEPGKLNVVIGPNASGKTNLVSVFEMLIAAYQRRLREYILDQGGMPLVAWDGREENVSLEIQVAGDLSQSAPRAYFNIELEQISRLSDFMIPMEEVGFRTDLASTEVAYTRTENFVSEHELDAIRLKPSNASVADAEALLPILTANMLDSCSEVQFQPVSLLQECLPTWHIFRNFETHPKAPVRNSAVTRYEKTLDSDGSNLVAYLHTMYSEDQEFREDFDSAMQAAFCGSYEGLIFAPASDRNIQLRVRWKGQKETRSTRDLSEGTLRFMYIIGILANPNLRGLTAIEEPEAGLNPSMFCIVAEFLADAAERAQVIVTTHSTEFLDALQEFKPTVTVSRLVNGETKLRTVAGDELDYWIKTYKGLGEFHRSGAAESLR